MPGRRKLLQTEETIACAKILRLVWHVRRTARALVRLGQNEQGERKEKRGERLQHPKPRRAA